MPLQHKSFVKTVSNATQTGIEEAIKRLDEEVNHFLKDHHWSQQRDSFQTIVCVNEVVLITRTVVYTTEQLAFGPQDKPPV